MSNEIPTWLKIMQNGSIGEARTRAFLMDRFWILERSVDIDGADFVIQRRITRNNLLDRDAPRLWVVQVKFFESEWTTQYIPKIYITDDENKPRDEFFVICNSGQEDSPRMFFLTAQMIFNDFKISSIDGIEKYRLPGWMILGTEKYLITSSKNTLDRIENQLILADFTKNRRFFSWRLPSPKIDIDVIHPDFKEPIDNWYCKIPEEFKLLKKHAYSAMNEIEDIYNIFREIVEEADPLIALDHLSDIKSRCCNSYGQWWISLPSELWDSDFTDACSEHLRKLNFLRDKWVLDKYIDMKALLKKSILGFINSNLPIAHDIIHSIFINFSTQNFEILSIEHKLLSIDEHSIISGIDKKDYHFGGVINISNDLIECYWRPGDFYLSDENKKDLSGFYASRDFRIYSDCMNVVFDLYYNGFENLNRIQDSAE